VKSNTLKATAKAPSNLAFVKYWGKRDEKLRIPTNNSISMNLSNATTRTSVEFNPELDEDRLISSGKNFKQDSIFFVRVFEHIDRIRELAEINSRASIITQNTFPEAVGIASSASGFAALTLAGSTAAGLNLNQKELSELARLGSGSACRSIPDGFVEWIAQDESGSSFATQLAPPDHWDIAILTVIPSHDTKKISSSRGHKLAAASPFFSARLETLDKRLDIVRTSIMERDFHSFGREVEQEAISFHSIAMTSPFQSENGAWNSGIYYWLPESIELILAVQKWREEGAAVYFTMDAGPTVHLICQQKDLELIRSRVLESESRIKGRKWEMLVNSPAIGARLVPSAFNGTESNT
jgi:diphosphomevalonate decarboxylase